MKSYVFPIIAVLTLFSACSIDGDDNNDDANDASSLVGTWNMTDVRFTEVDDATLILADEIVDELLAEDCFLVSFTFNADGTATAEDKVNYIEVNAGPSGLEVPCPSQSDIESTLWSLDGDQLTFINDNQEEETITIQLEEDTLIIAGEDIDEDNYAGAEAVFTRQ